MKHAGSYAIKIALVIATAFAAAAITIFLTDEFGWMKFAAWSVFFVFLCGPLYLTKGDLCPIKPLRLSKRS